MRKKLPMDRETKKSLALTFLLVLVIVVPLISGGVLASEVVESSEVVAEHAVVVSHAEPVVVADHDVVEGHGVGEDHVEDHGVGHVEAPWWKFTGWEAVFAVLATVFFLLLTRWLPVILEDKSGGSSL